MSTLFVLDLDGTLADASRRFAKAGKEPRKRGPAYTKWLKNVQSPKELLNDRPIPGTRDLARLLGNRAVYVTARSEIYRTVTSAWLAEHGYPSLALVMRPKRNRQSSGVFKERAIRGLVAGSESVENVLVIDDDPTGGIEAVCHKNGWTFFKARSGGYAQGK